MKKLIPILCVFLIGCSTYKEIPIQTIEKVVYKDSLIYLTDTVRIEIPKEITKEVLPDIDTSYLETSLAKSIAYLDKEECKLHHTLTQEGEVKTIIDTFFITQTITEEIIKEVPVEVEKIKYKYDKFFWISVLFNIAIILLFAFKLYMGRRGII